jgi:hypothetical protein
LCAAEAALTLEPQLPKQDVYEVRIYDSRRNRHLVAAIAGRSRDRSENGRGQDADDRKHYKEHKEQNLGDVRGTLRDSAEAEERRQSGQHQKEQRPLE